MKLELGMKFHVLSLSGSVVELQLIAPNGLHYFYKYIPTGYVSTGRRFSEAITFSKAEAEAAVLNGLLIPVEEEFL